MSVRTNVPDPERVQIVERQDLVTLVKQAIAESEQRIMLICRLVCLFVFMYIFSDSFRHFYYVWTTDENYSHGFLVPFISLYFANRLAANGSIPIRHGIWIGTLLLVLSLAVRLLTIPMPIPFLIDVALLIGLAGMFALDNGRCCFEALLVCLLFFDFYDPASYRVLLKHRLTVAIIR